MELFARCCCCSLCFFYNNNNKIGPSLSDHFCIRVFCFVVQIFVNCKGCGSPLSLCLSTLSPGFKQLVAYQTEPERVNSLHVQIQKNALWKTQCRSLSSLSALPRCSDRVHNDATAVHSTVPSGSWARELESIRNEDLAVSLVLGVSNPLSAPLCTLSGCWTT